MKLRKSIFHISQMDCAAEEQMVKMKLDNDPSIHKMVFDLSSRNVTVYHENSVAPIQSKIKALNLGEKLIESSEVSEVMPDGPSHTNERKLLWYVLLINGFCFLLEIATGIIAGSMGLVADSLDMLADALVYSLSLYVVGKSVVKKKNIAKISGYLQLLLALIGFSEVVRRVMGFESLPDFKVMIVISLIALTGNAVSLWLLQKSKSEDAHIKASMIFTSNDVIINIGVIIAALLVLLTSSNAPDLIIGGIVFVLVIRGALRILKLSR